MDIKHNPDGTYTVTVTTAPNDDCERDEHQPFRNRFAGGTYSAVLSDTEDMTPAAEVVYKKRAGGTSGCGAGAFAQQRADGRVLLYV